MRLRLLLRLWLQLHLRLRLRLLRRRRRGLLLSLLALLVIWMSLRLAGGPPIPGPARALPLRLCRWWCDGLLLLQWCRWQLRPHQRRRSRLRRHRAGRLVVAVLGLRLGS